MANDKRVIHTERAVFRRYFEGSPPARNTVAVSGIDAGLDVEIEVIAGAG